MTFVSAAKNEATSAGEAEPCAACMARGRIQPTEDSGIISVPRFWLPDFSCPAEVWGDMHISSAAWNDPPQVGSLTVGPRALVKCPHLLDPVPSGEAQLPGILSEADFEQAPEVRWDDFHEGTGLPVEPTAGQDEAGEEQDRRCELLALELNCPGKSRFATSTKTGNRTTLHALATPAQDRMVALVERRKGIPRTATFKAQLEDGPCKDHAGERLIAATMVEGGEPGLVTRPLSSEAKLPLFCHQRYRSLLEAVQEGNGGALIPYMWTGTPEKQAYKVSASACRPADDGTLEMAVTTYPDLRWDAALHMASTQLEGVGKAAQKALSAATGLTVDEATGDLDGVLKQLGQRITDQVELSGGFTCTLGKSFSSQPYQHRLGEQELLEAGRWISVLYLAGTLALDLLVAVASRGGPDVRVRLGYPDIRVDGSWGLSEGTGLAEVYADLDLKFRAAPLFAVEELRVDVTALLFDLAATAFPLAAPIILVVKHYVLRWLSTGSNRLRIWLKASGRAGGAFHYSSKENLATGTPPEATASGEMTGGFRLGLRTEASVGGDYLILKTGAGLDATVEGGLDTRVVARTASRLEPSWEGQLNGHGVDLHGAVYVNWDLRVSDLRSLLRQRILDGAREYLGGAEHLLEPVVDHALEVAGKSSIGAAIKAGLEKLHGLVKDNVPAEARSGEKRKTFSVQLMPPVTVAFSPAGLKLIEQKRGR